MSGSARFTLEAYFATDRRPDAGKHEFADGQIYAMSGGSPRHNHLTGHTYRLLAERLSGGPCVALPSDQRIATADGLYTYADASVFCGDIELGREQTARNPSVVVEVLSDSTGAYDRGEKLRRYQSIEALQHVVLIEPDPPDVEVWSRGPEGWRRVVYVEADKTVDLPAIGVALQCADPRIRAHVFTAFPWFARPPWVAPTLHCRVVTLETHVRTHHFALALALNLTACEFIDQLPLDGPDPTTADTAAPIDDALFDTLPGTMRDLGPARVNRDTPSIRFGTDDGEADPDPRDQGSRTEEDVTAPEGTVRFRLLQLDHPSGDEHEIEYDVAAGALFDAHLDAERLGMTDGFLPEDADEGGERVDNVMPRGWSDGIDTRVLRTPSTTWPWRTIGTLFDGSGDCTGTLVGPRHVLTAAHCIYDREDASWNLIEFKPGRNGADDAPYGSAGPIWYWIPQQYIDGAPGLNGYDIGLIVLDRPIGNGWMGYGNWAGAWLQDRNLYMRGYPRCGVEGSPTLPEGGCDPKTLWGDVSTCELGSFFNTDGDGWNREILTDCDGSAGQSGSSYYFYHPDSGVPVSMGVFSHHYCLGVCTGDEAQFDDFPNVITRITPYYRWVISWFRQAYPN